MAVQNIETTMNAMRELKEIGIRIAIDDFGTGQSSLVYLKRFPIDTVTIDRGSSSGIELNMPVVTPGGIVGRVITVSPWSAQIMLITDEHSGVGAIVGQLGQSNAIGPVKGLGQNGTLEMHNVSGLEVVNPGDYVLTTGQDAIYPPGLNVGEVVEVKKGTATVSPTIYIKPGARLHALEEVLVLLYRPPQTGTPDQVLPNVEKKK